MRRAPRARGLREHAAGADVRSRRVAAVPIDLTLCARYLPNDLAIRLVRRRVQDADEIARAEAGGDQGLSDRGYDRTQDARDLLSYLGSASHPPLLRATLAVASSPRRTRSSSAASSRCGARSARSACTARWATSCGSSSRGSPRQRATFAGYDDVLTAEQVAALAPLASHPVGSRRGFLLGHTLTGSRHPVRLRLREGSDANRNAAILSVGALGRGQDHARPEARLRGVPARSSRDRLRPEGRSPPARAAGGRAARRDDRAARRSRAARDARSAAHRACAPAPRRRDLVPDRPAPGALGGGVGGRGRGRRRRGVPARHGPHLPRGGAGARGRRRGRPRRREDARGPRRRRTDPARVRRPRRAPAAVGTRQVTYLPIRDLPAPARERRAPSTRRSSASASRSCA